MVSFTPLHSPQKALLGGCRLGGAHHPCAGLEIPSTAVLSSMIYSVLRWTIAGDPPALFPDLLSTTWEHPPKPPKVWTGRGLPGLEHVRAVHTGPRDYIPITPPSRQTHPSTPHSGVRHPESLRFLLLSALGLENGRCPERPFRGQQAANPAVPKGAGRGVCPHYKRSTNCGPWCRAGSQRSSWSASAPRAHDALPRAHSGSSLECAPPAPRKAPCPGTQRLQPETSHRELCTHGDAAFAAGQTVPLWAHAPLPKQPSRSQAEAARSIREAAGSRVEAAGDSEGPARRRRS